VGVLACLCCFVGCTWVAPGTRPPCSLRRAATATAGDEASASGGAPCAWGGADARMEEPLRLTAQIQKAKAAMAARADDLGWPWVLLVLVKRCVAWVRGPARLVVRRRRRAPHAAARRSTRRSTEHRQPAVGNRELAAGARRRVTAKKGGICLLRAVAGGRLLNICRCRSSTSTG
jgi:hypothetical protein